MTWTIQTLCQQLEVPFSGNGNLTVTQTSGLITPPPGSVLFSTNLSDLVALENCPDIAVVVPPDFQSSHHTLIFASDPLKLHTQIAQYLHPPAKTSGEIHPSAILGQNVTIGEGVTIDAHVILYDNVKIGNHSVLRAGVVVMENTSIGEHCTIHPNVSIRENCSLGNHILIHPNTVIGSDGYGFFQRDGTHHKIPQVGGVVIEDHVEIGANCAIDRARFDNTVIGMGTKLDNLVHVAHNVKIGPHSLLTAQTGIAGSVTTGKYLVMGGQSGISDHVDVGDGVTLMARTLITKNTKSHELLGGLPAQPARKWKRSQAMFNRLESLFDRVKRLERAQQTKES